MTKNEMALGIGLFIIGNAATLWAVFKWGVSRAIEYTHLQRDIKELKDQEKDQLKFNLKVLDDLKGLSIKIDNKFKSKD